MPVEETSERERVAELLSVDQLNFLEAIDENELGVDGIVSVFSEGGDRPPNLVSVRWAQADLGLRNFATLYASRVTGLEEVLRAMPRGRGDFELSLPFWASPAVGAACALEVRGAEALYVVDRDRLRASPVVRQCMRVEDLSPFRSKFRKLAKESSAYVLSLKGELTSVAVVTHLRFGLARLTVFTVEEARGRGFGRGVLTALAEELLASNIVPSVAVDLGHEPSVRMIEAAGFYQERASMRVRVSGPSSGGRSQPGSLVQLGPTR